MSQTKPRLLEVVIKTIVTHAVTYSIMGILASWIFDYATFFAQSSLNVMMRPLTDPRIMAGPLFQPIRGILFGFVFWLLREPFFGQKRGWLVMWITLVVVGILGTFGPTPGSLEGMFFTIFPLEVHLKSLPEVLLQSLLMSLILFYWVNRREETWLNWVMGIAFVVLMSFPVIGLLFG
jgi:hypothetical protein